MSDVPQSDEMRALVEARGATPEQLEAYAGQLDSLGLILAMQPGQPIYSIAELAERVGATVDRIAELRLALGFPPAEGGIVIGSDRDLALLTTLTTASELFGADVTLAMARVIGTSLATVADAVTSAFLVSVEFPHRERHGLIDTTSPEMIELTDQLVDLLSDGIDVVLRRHMIDALRVQEITVEGGFEVRDSAVGFVDLVGSTELAGDTDLAEFGRVLMRFESIATVAITSSGGRLVKFIGDEAMFTSAEPAVVVRIATEIAAAVAADETIPAVRVGVASGPTLHRDGDLFGPAVNLAARLASAAPAGGVLVQTHTLDAAGLPADVVAEYELAGFAEPVQAADITGASPSD